MPNQAFNPTVPPPAGSRVNVGVAMIYVATACAKR
jgi:hypothetical protein